MDAVGDASIGAGGTLKAATAAVETAVDKFEAAVEVATEETRETRSYAY